MNIAITTKALTSALTTALTPAQQPTLDELLAPLHAKLEDAEARYYCAQMTNDQWKYQQSHIVWLPRIAAIKKQIAELTR